MSSTGPLSHSNDPFAPSDPLAHAEGSPVALRRTEPLPDASIRRIAVWCETHATRIAACYLAETGRVFVVTRTRQFDFELADLISELEMELAAAGVFADIIQLPASTPETLLSFFDPASSRLVYGNSGGTSGQSGA